MRRRGLAVLSALVAAATWTVGTGTAPTAAARPRDATCAWMGPAAQLLASATRAAELVEAMTLDQQIAFLNLSWSATAENVTTAIPALCLPSFAYQDGPNGIALLGGEALPAEIALGATFDPGAATAYGVALGAAGAQRGDAAVQGPTLNLGVWPTWGRISETYGEDPYLAGVLGAAEVAGVQSTGTGVIIKHFGIYVREQRRGAAQLDTTDRALDEVFLSPFATVIAADHPLGVMCAFGHYDGTLQCASPLLMRRLAAMGFTGFVRTDLAATTDPAPALAAGVAVFKTSLAATMAAEIQDGQLDASLVTARATQVLTALFAAGLMDHPPVNSGNEAWTTAERTAAAKVGDESVVLLKDDRAVLPIPAGQRVTVIGAAATVSEQLTVGGSSAVNLRQPTNFLNPIVATFGARNVAYVQATPTTPAVEIPVPAAPPGPSTFTTTFTAPSSGHYVVQFTATTGNCSGTVSIDGHAVGSISAADSSGYVQSSRATVLSVGAHVVTVASSCQGTPPTLSIQPVDDALAAAAAAAASSAHPIVFVADQEGEQADRGTLDLSGYQNLLVQAVAKANPDTVVVIEAGGPIVMPWLHDVAGVVDVFYPGQVAGGPLARVLAGTVDPSGHLPVTFPVSDVASPIGDPMLKPNGVVSQLFGPTGNGLAWGMHYYAAKGLAVAFPFGFGLSYTTFATRDLTVTPTSTGWTLHATVQNTGEVAGRAVLQAYVTFPASTGEPANQLKSFTSVTLAPSQSATVTVQLTRSSLTIEPNGTPTVVPGTYSVALGQNALDLGLAVTFSVR